MARLLRDLEITYLMDEINAGSPNVMDPLAQSIGRGVRNCIAFANFKAHKFSCLNITSIGTDYFLNGKKCGFVSVNTPSCFSFKLAAFINNSDKLIVSQLFHHFNIKISNSMKCIIKTVS